MKKKLSGIKSARAPGQPELESLMSALLPLADLCIKSGYGVGELITAAKLASISIASKNSQIGNRLNHSRIAAITGLTRKEVRALTQSNALSPGAPSGQPQGQRIARVIEGWRTDPAYLTDSGTPAKLTVRGEDARFPELVRRYAGDVTPVSVLKELQRLAVVSKTKANAVRLLRGSLRSPLIGSEKIASFAERMRKIGIVLMRELEAPGTGQASVFETSKDLGPEEAALFLSLFTERAADLIDGAERWYKGQSALAQRDRTKKDRETHTVALRVIVSRD